MLSFAPRFLATTKLMRASLCSHGLTKTFILCCSIAFNLHKFEKRRQNYTYFHKPPNIFVSFLHFQPIFTFFRFAISRILCNFAPESIKSSSLLRLTRQPSFGNHGGQYDAEAILFTSKIPSYATAHLLHQVCSALRRHADS